MRASHSLGLSCVTSQQFGVVLVVLAPPFAWCLALEGLSRSESSRGWIGTLRSVFGVLPGAVQLVLFSLPRSLGPRNRLERPGVRP
ncbi:hypothetical protein Taro_047458 [Colocasia esculenta]|uniref:Uncharacterized protein n=1 Tax=Colocasia esculenta TaxID=4460 RepID=A0A843X6P5_COLES|nr:hypothetical protein [Colocasia esculenta]